MALSLDDILSLMQTRGKAQYGQEAVSQLEHALQCAHLAQVADEPPSVVAAALLHDLGHLLAAERLGADEAPTHEDDLHQYMAMPFLKGVFPEDVLAPIRLHVDAKRYLCLVEPGYWSRLSPASQASLALQGGVFSREQGDAFSRLPHSLTAVRLRRYDDLAKAPGLVVPGLSHYHGLLAQLLLRGPAQPLNRPAVQPG
jgi:phosphonate degradation associated HDIG domain protein